MGLNDEIIAVLSEDMGPAAGFFYRNVCAAIKADPAKIAAGDVEAFARYAYAMAKRSLDEATSRALFDRLMALKK